MNEQPPIRSATIFAVALFCGAGAFLVTLYSRAPRRSAFDSASTAAMSSRRGFGAMIADSPLPRDRFGLEKVAAERPDNYAVFFDLARITESQGDSAAAIKYYTTTVALAAEAAAANPNDLRPTFAAAWSLDRLGNKEEAATKFRHVADTYAARLEAGRANNPRVAYQRIGWSRAKLGNSCSALKAWQSALQILQDRPPESLAADESYDLGCLLALTGQDEQALTALNSAVAKGFSEPEWTRADEDLQTLHADPRFRELLVRMEERASQRKAGE